MSTKITYKKKFFILLFIIFIMSIASYKRSYSKVVNVYSYLDRSKDKLSIVQNSKNKIKKLQHDVLLLDKIIGEKSINPDIVQQEILNKFSSLNYGTDLIKLEETHKARNNYFNIYTNRLLVSLSLIHI